jgi:hypothetical protein
LSQDRNDVLLAKAEEALKKDHGCKTRQSSGTWRHSARNFTLLIVLLIGSDVIVNLGDFSE